VTGDAVIARDPAQIGSTLSEAPKSANVTANVSTAGGNAEDDTATSGDVPGLSTAHPKPAKRLNARERQMAKKSGGYNDKNVTEDGTKPMTAAAKSKVQETSNDKADEKANAKAELAKEKASLKAAQKAQKADTKARKISAAKAAKAARG
jgi:hypothetical protein